MVCGCVEGVEAMVLVLDFRAVGDREPDFAKAADDVLGHLGEWMELSEDPPVSRQGEIGRLFGQRSFEFKFAAAVSEGGLQFRFGGVDGFASGGLFLFGQTSELFHQCREFPVRAEIVHARLFQRGRVGGVPKLRQSRLLE